MAALPTGGARVQRRRDADHGTAREEPGDCPGVPVGPADAGRGGQVAEPVAIPEAQQPNRAMSDAVQRRSAEDQVGHG
jgi:hypothetical protein